MFCLEVIRKLQKPSDIGSGLTGRAVGFACNGKDACLHTDAVPQHLDDNGKLVDA
jgi:hypothetical protein